MKKLIIQDTLVSLTRVNDDDYISLTDTAFEFASWVSAESKLYLIKWNSLFSQANVDNMFAVPRGIR